MKGILFLSFFYSMQFNQQPTQTDLQSLDEARLRRQMQTIYGEFGVRRTSEWKVAIQGNIQTWTWDGEKFICPDSQNDPNFDCNQWVPLSFKWFLSSNRWLEPWVSMRRKGFFLGKPEPKSRQLNLQTIEMVSVGQEFEDESQEEQAWEWSGKRLASRIWEWVGRDGQSLNVYISLRNSWIERIDPDPYSSEYLEWKKENRYSKPALSKLVLDRQGMRVSFEHIRNLKK